ncbi:DUF2914 domain-containing protein [Psychrobium sp. 1_MG-2023]|uniref:DUF2914 domain-containing protein n=1 Tax=Psychrobium sp. 1_MG-2023 TaxID=3062624 RepID=UPI000C33A77B|nr:DUF2914 domain-containing protein [Psychrobium sp. 1_MG-2023]MDP2559550.1 DUF2914 domain-containing protein [Psychrobium sp. 1_MG-2023]PKF59388.1 hypothetical protein CW748_01030 [Alteromonadales bacterium alter-6D02]
MQLKIKIEVNPTQELLRSDVKPPFDVIKITKFVITVLLIIITIGYVCYRALITPAAQPKIVNQVMADVLEPSQPIAEKIEPEISPSDKAIEKAPPQTLEGKVLEAQAPDRLIKAGQPEERFLTTPHESPKAASLSTQSLATNVVKQVKAVALSNHADRSSQQNSHIVRAQLTSAIVAREPLDKLNSAISLATTNQVYLFSEVKLLNGQDIFHRWSLEGEVLANVRLSIDGDNWRTYSSKAFTDDMVGAWKVEVVNQQNEVIHSVNFDIAH